MSAKELLQKFKSMPLGEQRKFLREVGRPAKRAPRAPRQPRKVQWPDVELRSRQITGGRVLPNLVLADRDDAAF